MRTRATRRTAAWLSLILIVPACAVGAVDARPISSPDSTPLPPADATVVPTSGPEARSLGVEFRHEGFELRTIPVEELPYSRDEVWPIEDGRPTDEHGVRVFEAGGQTYDHPVAQAGYALYLLSSYRLTGDEAFLEVARRQADRIIETAVAVDDALYFPYPFNFRRHTDASDVMRAPWYSAMAQGQALSLFVRLDEATGDERYREAAEAALNSFFRVREDAAPGDPWTVLVTDEGYLWFEEYAAEIPDITFNGMVFALYGLYDYWRVTDDPDVRRLIEGGLVAVDWAAGEIRVPGGVSRYCVEHGVQNRDYHRTHVFQLATLHEMTGDERFANWSALLAADHAP